MELYVKFWEYDRFGLVESVPWQRGHFERREARKANRGDIQQPNPNKEKHR